MRCPHSTRSMANKKLKGIFSGKEQKHNNNEIRLLYVFQIGKKINNHISC